MDWMTRVMRRNVGFLYNPGGKACYHLFICVICFSITDPKDAATGCGIAVAASGVLQFLLYFKNPQYFDRPVVIDNQYLKDEE
jgi:hypothetical protein